MNSLRGVTAALAAPVEDLEVEGVDAEATLTPPGISSARGRTICIPTRIWLGLRPGFKVFT